MSYGLRSLFFAIFSGLFGLVSWSQNHVTWSGKYDPSSQQITAHGIIDSTWHIYSPKTDAGLGPIALSIRLMGQNGSKKQGAARFLPEPTAYMDENFGGIVYVWEKEVTIHQKVKLDKSCKMVKAVINYMICDETQCLPPMDVELDIPLTP
jgi:thiol:disulfide interchange protein DsbD